MTTSSSKVVLRVLPVALVLAALLLAALTFAPDSFRYRGWPKPPRTTPLESLVALSPQLGAGDPIAAARAPRSSQTADVAGGTRAAISAPVPRPSVSIAALMLRGGLAGSSPARRDGGASRSGSSQRNRGSGNGSNGAKRPSASANAIVAKKPTRPVTTEARVVHPAPATYPTTRPAYTPGHYARRTSDGNRGRAYGEHHSYGERAAGGAEQPREWDHARFERGRPHERD